MRHYFTSFNATALATALGMFMLSPAMAQTTTAAAHGKAVAAKPPYPSLRLTAKSNGESAIAQLGDNLPAVAAFYGKTPAEFAKQLRTDRTAWLDKNGRLFYTERGLTTSGSNLAPSNVIYPLEKTFLLHSRPGSKRKIYLDFNGHITTGTDWNLQHGMSTIVSPPFDTDAVPGSFNAGEMALIQNVWRRVSEDYAPFDVDVTTEEPPHDQMTRAWAGDDTYGVRAVITSDFTASTSTPCNCGGIAYAGSFDEMHEGRKPAFIFMNQLGYGEKPIAEIVSHEVGHTVGLAHDGTYGSTYYGGHDTGVGGWAPIMGSGFGRSVVQFSRGQYEGANNTEDDFQVMHNNGMQFAADDFGNDIATARGLAGTVLNFDSTYDALGLIETPSDVDVFKFASNPGTATITAAPFELSPNLDMMIDVRDANGNLIATANPTNTMGASLSVPIPVAGTYYLRVQGVSEPFPTNHPTDYGSLGRYSLRVTAPVGNSAPSCAIFANVYRSPSSTRISVSGANSKDAFGPIESYHWNWGDGTAPGSGPTATHSYFEPGTFVTTLTVNSLSGMRSSCQYTTQVTITGIYR